MQQILDAEHRRIGDDGVGEERVQGQKGGRHDVEPALVVDVLDEDVCDALLGLVVQQRAAHSHDDVEEAGEQQRAVKNAAELRFVVHRTLRGGAVEGDGEAQTAHAKHVRKVVETLWPQEGRIKIDLVGEASVNDVKNDR